MGKHFAVRGLGFRYRKRSLSQSCNEIPLYIPSSGDSYTLSELGTAANTMATISNGFIQYTVNGGPAKGQIGNGTTSPGIKFDPNGGGNYGNDDYVSPGTPYEAYGFQVNSGSGNVWIGGVNSDHNTDFLPGNTTMWDLSSGSTKHIVCMRGNEANGFVVTQYMTKDVEPVIRIKMSYTNTTGNSATVKCFRGCDPDVGAIQYNVYNTLNYRGYGSISSSDIVVAQETNTNKPFALYANGNGYTHTTAILSSWPTLNISAMLAGTDDGNGDHAMFMAWDFGSILNGSTVNVCCYYIIGSNIDRVIGTIG